MDLQAIDCEIIVYNVFDKIKWNIKGKVSQKLHMLQIKLGAYPSIFFDLKLMKS